MGETKGHHYSSLSVFFIHFASHYLSPSLFFPFLDIPSGLFLSIFPLQDILGSFFNRGVLLVLNPCLQKGDFLLQLMNLRQILLPLGILHPLPCFKEKILVQELLVILIWDWRKKFRKMDIGREKKPRKMKKNHVLVDLFELLGKSLGPQKAFKDFGIHRGW